MRDTTFTSRVVIVLCVWSLGCVFVVPPNNDKKGEQAEKTKPTEPEAKKKDPKTKPDDPKTKTKQNEDDKKDDEKTVKKDEDDSKSPFATKTYKFTAFDTLDVRGPIERLKILPCECPKLPTPDGTRVKPAPGSETTPKKNPDEEVPKPNTTDKSDKTKPTIPACLCNHVKIRGEKRVVGVMEALVEGNRLLVRPTVERVDTSLPLTVEVRTNAFEGLTTYGVADIYAKGFSSQDLKVDVTSCDKLLFIGTSKRLTVESSGSSDMEFLNLKSDTIKLNTSGSSDIKLLGTSKYLDIESSGASEISAKKLTAQNVKLDISGASNISVCAAQSLDMSISGASNIGYYCNPKNVKNDISGASTVRSMSH